MAVKYNLHLINNQINSKINKKSYYNFEIFVYEFTDLLLGNKYRRKMFRESNICYAGVVS